MADEVFGDEDADGVSGAVSMNVADVVEDWGGDLSVGRVDDFQLDGNLACAPFVGERLGFFLVDLNGERGRDDQPAWMRLGRLTPAGVGVNSAVTRR